jgi:ATP adenylyltransferase
LQNLWAPWRMTYIESSTKQNSKECFLCKAATSTNHKEDLMLERNKDTVVVLNLYPYNPGHVLVAPTKHVRDFSEISKEELCSLFITMSKWIQRLELKMKPDGFNVGANLGSVAGAGLPDHVHIHVVPRWKGDTNFMPTIASVKIIPELLESTYEKLVYQHG